MACYQELIPALYGQVATCPYRAGNTQTSLPLPHPHHEQRIIHEPKWEPVQIVGIH